MDKTHITMKVWRDTLRKLRMIYALTDESMVEILDRVITNELEKIGGDAILTNDAVRYLKLERDNAN